MIQLGSKFVWGGAWTVAVVISYMIEKVLAFITPPKRKEDIAPQLPGVSLIYRFSKGNYLILALFFSSQDWVFRPVLATADFFPQF